MPPKSKPAASPHGKLKAKNKSKSSRAIATEAADNTTDVNTGSTDDNKQMNDDNFPSSIDNSGNANAFMSKLKARRWISVLNCTAGSNVRAVSDQGVKMLKDEFQSGETPGTMITVFENQAVSPSIRNQTEEVEDADFNFIKQEVGARAEQIDRFGAYKVIDGMHRVQVVTEL